MATKLDIIIFGASGFTGKYTVFEAAKILSKLTWGIAGRSKSKLEGTLKEMGEKAGTDLSKIPIIIADLDDPKSLRDMTNRCKIIVNCSGPYRFFGEPVIKACIETSTHHVDVSGEPQYMETMQLKYNAQAREKGIYIVSACGFDSIPADLGTVYAKQEFDGILNSVELYVCTDNKHKAKFGEALLHYGTWASAVHGLADRDKLKNLRAKLYDTKLPRFSPPIKNRFFVHQRDFVEGYCLPFPGADKSVVTRSQRFFYDHDNQRPIQVRAYVQMKNILSILLVSLVGVVFTALTQFEFGRKLLLNYPRIFSLGTASHEGPSEESMRNTEFKVMVSGNGWSKDVKVSEPTDSIQEPPNKYILAQVCGTNPGYGATCVSLLLSAMTILKEGDKMPDNGGVFTPAGAFAKTSLISELSKNGFKFEVLKKRGLVGLWYVLMVHMPPHYLKIAD